jgi:hypothetical protein
MKIGIRHPIFNLSPSASVDEGKNWINMSWGRLVLTHPVTGGILGSYALASGSPAINFVPTSDPFAGRASKYYVLVWGVDPLRGRAVESGELIRLSYEVLDPGKAGSLGDKKLEPKLIAPDAHVMLVIPSLEKVSQLRQSSTPEAGKSYWDGIFEPAPNRQTVDRVNVVIGLFHADGLLVE